MAILDGSPQNPLNRGGTGPVRHFYVLIAAMTPGLMGADGERETRVSLCSLCADIIK